MNLAYFSGLAKPDLAMSDRVMSGLANTDCAKSGRAKRGLAKPESGRLLFWGCVEDLRPPSGVCWCTSERTESKCDAYAIDTSALRFLSFGLRI